MAECSGKRGGADRVLESRHLVGLFLGVVLLCGVFFTLGYVMGRSQYGGSVHAAATALTPARRPLRSEDTGSDKAHFHPAPAQANGTSTQEEIPIWNPPKPRPHPAVRSANTAAKRRPRRSRLQATFAPPGARGSIVLPGCRRHASRATRWPSPTPCSRRNFPAFVVTPAADNFYRVQVGPYSDDRAAESAKAALDREGFKAIIKR